MGNKQPVDRATATLTQPMDTDAQKITVTSSAVVGIQASTNYAGATPELKTSVENWGKLGVALDTNGKANDKLRKALIAGESKQRKLRSQWGIGKRQVLTNLTAFCDGDVAMMGTFSVEVLTHTPGTHALAAAPEGIVTSLGKGLGQSVCQWKRGKDKAWVVQWATDAANPATYSQQIAWSKKRYTLSGQTSGAHVFFRVAVQDSSVPEGHGTWSTWISASVR